MKKGIFVLLVTVFVTSSAAAQMQQTEQDVAGMISAQVTSVSTELLNLTRATVFETLDAWGDELFSTDSSSEAGRTDPVNESQ